MGTGSGGKFGKWDLKGVEGCGKEQLGKTRAPWAKSEKFPSQPKPGW